MQTPISQLNQNKFVKIDMKPGDVWQIGRSFFRNNESRTVTIEAIRDVGDILRRRTDLMISPACMDMANKNA